MVHVLCEEAALCRPLGGRRRAAVDTAHRLSGRFQGEIMSVWCIEILVCASSRKLILLAVSSYETARRINLQKYELQMGSSGTACAPRRRRTRALRAEPAHLPRQPINGGLGGCRRARAQPMATSGSAERLRALLCGERRRCSVVHRRTPSPPLCASSTGRETHLQ